MARQQGRLLSRQFAAIRGAALCTGCMGAGGPLQLQTGAQSCCAPLFQSVVLFPQLWQPQAPVQSESCLPPAAHLQRICVVLGEHQRKVVCASGQLEEAQLVAEPAGQE